MTRVAWARVVVREPGQADRVVGACGPGLLVLAASHRDDTDVSIDRCADRIAGLRIFEDEEGKMNLSLAQIPSGADQAQVLCVSNFTVLGDTGRSRRPSFGAAAPFDQGRIGMERLVQQLRARGLRVEEGVFGAEMLVESANDGPVTVIVETEPPSTAGR